MSELATAKVTWEKINNVTHYSVVDDMAGLSPDQQKKYKELSTSDADFKATGTAADSAYYQGVKDRAKQYKLEILSKVGEAYDSIQIKDSAYKNIGENYLYARKMSDSAYLNYLSESGMLDHEGPAMTEFWNNHLQAMNEGVYDLTNSEWADYKKTHTEDDVKAYKEMQAQITDTFCMYVNDQLSQNGVAINVNSPTPSEPKTTSNYYSYAADEAAHAMDGYEEWKKAHPTSPTKTSGIKDKAESAFEKLKNGAGKLAETGKSTIQKIAEAMEKNVVGKWIVDKCRAIKEFFTKKEAEAPQTQAGKDTYVPNGTAADAAYYESKKRRDAEIQEQADKVSQMETGSDDGYSIT